MEPTARHPLKADVFEENAATATKQTAHHDGRVVSPKRNKTRIEVDVENIGEIKPAVRRGAGTKDAAAAAEAAGRKPMFAYVLLVAALLALSSLGAALKLQGPGVTPTMKAYWRMVATAVTLIPVALVAIRRDGLPRLTSQQFREFMLCTAGYATMTGSFAVSLSMSSMAETFILGNTGGLVIIAKKMVTRQPVLMGEGWGAAIGFLGGIICADDSPEEGGDTAQALQGEHYHPIKGGLIAFLASCGLAVYLTLAKDLRPNMDLFVFMLCIMTTASFYLLLFMFLRGEEMSLSNHHEHGLWGWTNLSRDRLPIEIHLAVVCNLIGTTGYVASMKYFDAVVVSTCMLMEPLMATLMGAAAGVDQLPGVQTWVGGAIVTAGSMMVILADAKRNEVKPHAQ